MGNEIPGVASTAVKIPVCFIGVGLEGEIKASNKRLLDSAKLVIVRDRKSLDQCARAILAPDLVFAIPTDPCHALVGFKKQVTVLLNDFVSPGGTTDEEWKVLAYYWFINQFSDACNDLAEAGYSIHFIPMCVGSIDDRRIAAAVVGRIRRKDRVNWYLRPVTEAELLAQISLSEFVITQRFHGIIFSTICGTPFVSLRAHDKMLHLVQEMKWQGDLDYYGVTKLQLEQATTTALRSERKQLLDFAKDCAVSWTCISDIVTKELSL